MASSSSTTREIIINVPSTGFRGEIDEVGAAATLAEIRKRVEHEFGAENLPQTFLFETVSSSNKGIMIAQAQEAKKKAWKYQELTVVDRSSRRRRKSNAETEEDDNPAPLKKARSSGRGEDGETTINGHDPKQQQPRRSSLPKPPPVSSVSVSKTRNDSMLEDQQTVSTAVSESTAKNAPSILSQHSQEEEDKDDEEMPVVETRTTKKKKKEDADAATTTTTTQQETLITNPQHEAQTKAIAQSCQVLRQLQTVIDAPYFCSQERRGSVTAEITKALQKTAPETVIGVLGNTGVGKSSLLNALLDEASVLPTSGSRGCTAAVVELKFNAHLIESASDTAVYQGEVEFITLHEWSQELKLLVNECSTHETKKIHLIAPEEERQPDAAAAWQKIDQVYGAGTMYRYRGKDKEMVYNQLINNPRVKRLLTPPPGKAYNAVLVEEGSVNAAQAKEILAGHRNMSVRNRRTKKKWAAAFRSKINDYVYRKGNGSAPQTWPLIRKVVLQGPWSVLSTGACLVDLPGVRDANAARAKVAERYLQDCSQVWIVAPIKRAVDDGTAKELLGEQFKRRLLMDGQYGNVSFICTQTDDCEPTEIMRDHADVAQKVPGRLEQMEHLAGTIGSMEKALIDLEQEEDDLVETMETADQELKDAEAELQEAQEDGAVVIDVDDDPFADLKKDVAKAESRRSKALSDLDHWRTNNKNKLDDLKCRVQNHQCQLKSLCAIVRNEYSKGCLQEDFKNGLKKLTRNDDDDGGAAGSLDNNTSPLPDDFEMDVYCISANDYLKVEGIKPKSDGPPSCFLKAQDTQIPALRSFVHTITANYRETFSTRFVDMASDMLERVKLIAGGARNVPSGRTSQRCSQVFQSTMHKLRRQIDPIADTFFKNASHKVSSSLGPSIRTGAEKGQHIAMTVVQSWGSKSRRSRHERSFPHKNGLHYPTYNATARRGGEYVSGSAGEINWNQELCEPVEKEFGTSWQQVMDSTVSVLLRKTETEIIAICTKVNQQLLQGLAECGVDARRLQTIGSTATRTCTNALKEALQSIKTTAVDAQRDLNRSLLPIIKERMSGGYQATQEVARGTGTFNRMKGALERHTQRRCRQCFLSRPRSCLTQPTL